MLHVPFERGGHADEAHGFGGGRAIEHDHLVALLAPVLIHVHHGAELFHAGKDRQLFGLHVADAGGSQHGDDVGRDLAPVPLDFLLDVDLLDGEVIVDGQRIVGAVLEQAGFEIEGVGQAVCGIDAHHERAVAEAGELETGGRGNAGLAHASFAAEEQDAHASILTGQRTACGPALDGAAEEQHVPVVVLNLKASDAVVPIDEFLVEGQSPGCKLRGQ